MLFGLANTSNFHLTSEALVALFQLVGHVLDFLLPGGQSVLQMQVAWLTERDVNI